MDVEDFYGPKDALGGNSHMVNSRHPNCNLSLLLPAARVSFLKHKTATCQVSVAPTALSQSPRDGLGDYLDAALCPCLVILASFSS